MKKMKLYKNWLDNNGTSIGPVIDKYSIPQWNFVDVGRSFAIMIFFIRLTTEEGIYLFVSDNEKSIYANFLKCTISYKEVEEYCQLLNLIATLKILGLKLLAYMVQGHDNLPMKRSFFVF